MNKKYTYNAIIPKQSEKFQVFAICAKANDILEFAYIDRIGRDENGKLKGFQRPQVANHIKEIKAYLSKEDAVLPNSIVVAFTEGVTINNQKNGSKVTISINEANKGFIVDGQQRISALSEIPEKDFEVFMTGIVCTSEEELRKQFILINNTKPLPKSLIYELLPTVEELPHRLSSRSQAASLVERLNYDESSSLHGQINQHTNPIGYIKDTVLQKVLMNSIADGSLREIYQVKQDKDKQFEIISNFFKAVQKVFKSDWEGKTPKTSRLVHGSGIVAMGYVMEFIYGYTREIDINVFEKELTKLKDHCAWTEGNWHFGESNIRPWNSIQNTPSDYMALSQYLIKILKSK